MVSLPGAMVLVALVVAALESAVQVDRRSLRSVERLRYDCLSEIGRREVTLFGNGTVRLREGIGGEQKIWLHELSASELTAYINRLSESSRAETELDYSTVEGAWVERCQLHLDLPNRGRERFEFGRYDTLSLDLQRAVNIALELGDVVDQRAPPEGAPRLPRGYLPKVGDILRRVDGRRFRVVGFTWDGQGIELAGLEDPLTLYMPRSELGKRFVILEPR